MDLNQLKIGVLNTQILERVYNLAIGKLDGLTIGFMPNDPEILNKVTKYRQYTLAFEVVNELAVAIGSEGMNVNPFVQELLLNMLTMANDQVAWTSENTRLEFVFINVNKGNRRKIDVAITFVYNGVTLFDCKHNFAVKAV